MSKKAVFLDRDGVINVDYGYVHHPRNFKFKDGIFELCKSYQDKGYLLIVVTNQSGLARGLYSESQFLNLNFWMLDQFMKKEIVISKIYYCPHHPESGCECRKPKPELILRASYEFDIDLSSSLMYGDKESDILAARNAGLGRAFLVDGINESFEVIKEYKVIK